MPTVHLVKPFIAKSNNFYFSRNNSKYTLNLKENYAKLTSHVFVLWKQLTILNQGNQKEQIFYLKQFIDHFQGQLKQQELHDASWFCFGVQPTDFWIVTVQPAKPPAFVYFHYIQRTQSNITTNLCLNTFKTTKNKGSQRESREQKRKQSNHSQGKAIKPMHRISFLRINCSWQNTRGAFKTFPPVNMFADTVTVRGHFENKPLVE